MIGPRRKELLIVSVLSGAYNKAFGDHLLAAYARYSINENSTKTTTFSMMGFPNDKLSEVHMGTGV